MFKATNHQGNADQKYRYVLRPTRMTIIKKTIVGKDVEKRNFYIYKLAQSVGKPYGASWKKVKKSTTKRSINTTSGHISKGNENKTLKVIWPHMNNAAIILIAQI